MTEENSVGDGKEEKSERDCVYLHPLDEGNVCTNDHSLRWPKCWIEETGINNARECSLFNCQATLDGSTIFVTPRK